MADLKYVTGDILTPNKDEDHGVLVCYQVNRNGVMGGGLARQVRNKYPDVYCLYRDKCRQIADCFGGQGGIQFCSLLSDAGYIIANIFGRKRCGLGKRRADYEGLQKAFETIARYFPDYTIRIPYNMGCGLGGGDWPVVLNIIRDTLVSAGIDVEIWTLPGKRF